MGHSERDSTKTLNKRVKNGGIEAKKLRRKGKNNSKNHKETCGRINDCKTIHEQDQQFPTSSTNQAYRHFEGDTIVGKHRQPAIVILVETTNKYMVLLKASRKSQEVKETT